MPLGLKKFGMVGVALGLMLMTGCMETTGPAPETSKVQSSTQKTSARTIDSTSSVGLSLGRMGTALVNATFKTTNE